MATSAVEFAVVVVVVVDDDDDAGGDASGCVIIGCSSARGGEGDWGSETRVPKLASPNVLID